MVLIADGNVCECRRVLFFSVPTPSRVLSASAAPLTNPNMPAGANGFPECCPFFVIFVHELAVEFC